MSRLATFRHWFSKSAHPVLTHLARQVRLDASRFIAWLDRFLTANKFELALLAALAALGYGLTLRWGLWLGLAVPGSVVTLAVLYQMGLAARPRTPSKSTLTQRS